MAMRGRTLVCRALVLAATPLLWGCEPLLNVGAWSCASDRDAAASADETAAIELPWSTGFEDGFCDYTQLGGFRGARNS